MLRTATSPTDWKDILPNPATDERVPVIARIAGLPISAATELRGEGTVAALGKLTVTEEAASALRRAVADDLYRAVPEVDPVFRRRILLLKRNCFNNRPLGALDDEHLEALRPWTDDRLERIIALEEELAEHWNELRECYADDRERSRRRRDGQRACGQASRRRPRGLAGDPPERALRARTLDGSFNDLSSPRMGAVGARFGRNIPIDRTFPTPGSSARELLELESPPTCKPLIRKRPLEMWPGALIQSHSEARRASRPKWIRGVPSNTSSTKRRLAPPLSRTERTRDTLASPSTERPS